jgi:3-deoxy-D-manno-octulosonate 8-phosphate phosphatase (KDO 8-P phosphatase)
MRILDESACDLAKAVRVVIMDVDGVLTDGRVLFTESGEGLLFNVQDGTGLKYLHRSGIGTALVSGRVAPAVLARASALGIEHVVQGAKEKIEAYAALQRALGFDDASAAYVGDDLTDLPVMERVGLSVAVANAVPEVLERAHAVTCRRGGDGAVREVAEFVLKAQGKWAGILSRYTQGERGASEG